MKNNPFSDRKSRLALATALVIAAFAAGPPARGAQKTPPKEPPMADAAERWRKKAKPVPHMQALPLPYHQVSLQRNGVELCRYHHAPEVVRPFIYPINGPSGRCLTRIGHPHDPVGHGHHFSVWTSHHNVNGSNFWTNNSGCRIQHLRVLALEDADARAAVSAENAWKNEKGAVLLKERRRVAVRPLADEEWLLLYDLELHAAGKKPVTLGKTPFGVFSVRMAKTIGVHDGGGTIRNSEGGVDEKEIFWKRAKWVDYAGAIVPDVYEGVTLLDHPDNPNHPTFYHVRNDGWMGASLTLDGPRTIQPGKPLRLRYGLYVHSGFPAAEAINKQWEAFAKLPRPARIEKD
jgi:hypothetical protein